MAKVNSAKRVRKSRKVISDVKLAAANDVQPEAVVAPNQSAAPKLPPATASAVKSGAMYAVLAGRPSKAAVIATFGKSGYALSWLGRAEKMGIPSEQLCSRFKDLSTRDLVKSDWEAVNVKKEKATTKS